MSSSRPRARDGTRNRSSVHIDDLKVAEHEDVRLRQRWSKVVSRTEPRRRQQAPAAAAAQRSHFSLSHAADASEEARAALVGKQRYRAAATQNALRYDPLTHTFYDAARQAEYEGLWRSRTVSLHAENEYTDAYRGYARRALARPPDGLAALAHAGPAHSAEPRSASSLDVFYELDAIPAAGMPTRKPAHMHIRSPGSSLGASVDSRGFASAAGASAGAAGAAGAGSFYRSPSADPYADDELFGSTGSGGAPAMMGRARW